MLDISPVLLISSAVIFLLVLARLNSCLYKPLFKHMEDRDAKIASDLADAKTKGADVDDMLQEAKSIIAKAKSEAAAIREKATSEAKEVADSKLAEAKDQLETKYNDFVSAIADEKTTLKSSLTASMPLFQESLKAKINSI